jgi:hypothetical protein
MELRNWPPQAGGAFDPRKDKFATSTDVLIEEVTSVKGREVMFTCTLDGKQHTYDFCAPDEKVAQKLGTILRDNVSKPLSSVGTIEIPSDKSES